MVISFERHLQKRREKEAYRQELVDRIIQHHKALGRELSESYLDHVRHGFPLEILEGIVQKLDQDRAAHNS